VSLRDKQSPDYFGVLIPFAGLAMLLWIMIH
jgi:hypothetical protein